MKKINITINFKRGENMVKYIIEFEEHEIDKVVENLKRFKSFDKKTFKIDPKKRATNEEIRDQVLMGEKEAKEKGLVE